MNETAFDLGLLAPAIVAGLFILLLVLEFALPLRRRKYPQARRLVVNLLISALAFVVGAFLLRPVASSLVRWTAAEQFGLLHLVNLPFPLEFVLGFLLMDLSFYYWHRANHVVPVLWRFHNVHHLDPDLDVSTSFRFHFGEILYSIAFRALQVCLIGVPATTYIVYELVFQCSTLFHHSNLRLAIRVERGLNRVLVTPRMHGIHHSGVQDETNSNYSVIFRWWDRLHRTLRLGVSQGEIDIGVAGYREPKDNGLWNLCVLPFRAQREYWPAGSERRARVEDASNGLLE